MCTRQGMTLSLPINTGATEQEVGGSHLADDTGYFRKAFARR